MNEDLELEYDYVVDTENLSDEEKVFLYEQEKLEDDHFELDF
jgi:hypothetical protein